MKGFYLLLSTRKPVELVINELSLFVSVLVRPPNSSHVSIDFRFLTMAKTKTEAERKAEAEIKKGCLCFDQNVFH